MIDIPYGYCHCGCGQKTTIPDSTDRSNGKIKGQPRKYVRFHHRTLAGPLYVEDESGCWIWQRSYRGAYGQWGSRRDGGTRLAHRALYEHLVGPVPDGYDLDHLCRNPACVNPDHLEPVTHRENMRRGSNARLTAAQVGEIRRLSDSGVRNRDICKQYGLSSGHVSNIVKGRAWRDVEDEAA